MRKTEKFYENFNKLKVSPEQAVERFEFRDVKTLDAMVSEAKKINSEGKGLQDKYFDANFKREDAGKAYDSILDKMDAVEDKYKKIQKENTKRIDDVNKELLKTQQTKEKLGEKYNKAYAKT